MEAKAVAESEMEAAYKTDVAEKQNADELLAQANARADAAIAAAE